MYDLAVLNARRADAAGLWNIAISEGKIAGLVPAPFDLRAKEYIKANELVVMPGLIDAHVHTRDPGYTYKESFQSVSGAAAAGGVTTIFSMPNSNPPLTNKAAVEYAAKSAESKAFVDVRFVGGAVTGIPSWMEELTDDRVAAIDVYDDAFAYGSAYWARLFSQAKNLGKPLCFYLMDSEIERLRKKAYREDGKNETEIIVNATNGLTECMSICRIFPMAAYFDCPVVLRMVSTAEALQCVRQMRSLYPNAKVYVEVCVHYMFLANSALGTVGSLAHIHPPLRSEKDIDAMWEAVRDGTIDYIASDHAPHAAFEKGRDHLADCASGMVGLETMLPLLMTAHAQGEIGLKDIQRLCCEAPARIYGITGKGNLKIGNQADLVLVDCGQKWTVKAQQSFSKGAPSPFGDWELMGKPKITICNGRKIFENGKIIQDSKE